MDNIEFSKELELRTLRFAIQILKTSALLPFTSESKVIKNQISKSGTSVGANYREANRARSKADFKNKIKICESEASETVYWLEIIAELKLVEDNKLKPVQREAKEVLAIFTSITKNLKK
jgi:four helix bundle protein